MRRSAVIREASVDTLQWFRGHLTNCLWTPHEFSADTSQIVYRHLTTCPWNRREGSTLFCGSKFHNSLTSFPFECDRTRVRYCGCSVCIMRCNVYLMRCNVCLESKCPIKYLPTRIQATMISVLGIIGYPPCVRFARSTNRFVGRLQSTHTRSAEHLHTYNPQTEHRRSADMARMICGCLHSNSRESATEFLGICRISISYL